MSAEELESYLRKQSQKNSTPMVRTLLSTLGDAIIMNESNVETNRKLWDLYATNWSEKNPMIQSMAHHSRSLFNSSNNCNDNKAESKKEELTCLGDEWSREQDVTQVIKEYILPYLDLTNHSSNVIEIGSGGGRVSCKICDYCNHLYCFDISKEMLSICEKYLNSLNKQNNISFHLLKCDINMPQKPPSFPKEIVGKMKFDFIFAFDAFVHMDIHTQFSYFKEIFNCLKDNQYAFIHTSNIETNYGFNRFAKQTHATVAGFYFVNPSMVNLLLKKVGFTIVKQSNINGDNKKQNVYYQRDYLVIVKKVVEKCDNSTSKNNETQDNVVVASQSHVDQPQTHGKKYCSFEPVYTF